MAKKKKKTNSLPQKNSTPQSWLSNIQWHQAFIFLTAFLLYGNTLNHQYTQDDAIVIYDNMFTTDGISGIPGILQYDTFYGFFKVEGKDKLVAGGRYRPLTLVLFAIEYELFGKNPFVGHLGNVLLYGLLGVVLYLLLLRLLQFRNKDYLPPFLALIVTLFFMAHPIHTEVVANIKGRDEIVTLLGSLSALLFSIKAFDTKKIFWNILAGLVFFLGLMAKENAITFLAVVPLTYFVFTKADFKKIALQTVPFVAAAIIFLFIRGQVLGGNFSDSVSMELMNNPFLKIENGQWVALSFGEQMATIIYTLGKYIQLLIVPHPLTHDYYPRHIELMSWGDWQVVVSLLAYIGLGVAGLIGSLKKQIWGYATLYYLITLSVVSNIVFPIGTNMSERFLFMPSVGFCLLLGLLLYPNRDSKNIQAVLVQPKMLLALLVLALFSAKTIHRNQAWTNNFTLFTTDIEVSRNSAKLRNSVGGELSAAAIKMTDEAQRMAMLQEAIGHLNEAIKIHPTYKNAYLLLGNAYNYLKQYDQAIQYYNQALRLDPNYPDAINNRAITYRDGGLYFGQQQGNLAKAIQYLTEAQKTLPNDYETVFGLGVAQGMSGNLDAAIQLFVKSTQLQPNSAAAWRNLGNAYMNAERAAEGQAALAKAAALEGK
ncbi:MAG: tetratricopeptide repeat protein [Bacteroidota bacterium]